MFRQPYKHRPLSWGLLLCIILCLPVYGATALGDSSSSFESLVLNVMLNHRETDQTVIALRDRNHNIYLAQEDLNQFNIQFAKKTAVLYNNIPYYSLNDFSKVDYFIDDATETLNITLPTDNFHVQVFNDNPQPKNFLRPKQPGFYVDYDASYQHDAFDNTDNTAALSDFVYFNSAGVGSSQFFANTDPNASQWTRLETRWTLDQPENMATWRFGDTISSTDIWTGAVRMGGIQYATNFATAPNFVTFPLPAFSGEATVPTTVNFYLNNQLQATQDINSGPFTVQGLPVVTGNGVLTVNTKDILGRETTVSLPYYASSSLLKSGLSDFSYEAGAIRNNYGLVSNDYSRAVTVGTYRYGIEYSDCWQPTP